MGCNLNDVIEQEKEYEIKETFNWFLKNKDYEVFTIGLEKSHLIVSEECMLYYNLMNDYEKILIKFLMKEESKGRMGVNISFYNIVYFKEFLFSLIKTKKGLEIYENVKGQKPYALFLREQFSIIRDKKLESILK